MLLFGNENNQNGSNYQKTEENVSIGSHSINNLFLLLSGSKQSKKTDGNSQDGANNINIDHRVVKIHNNYSFENNKLSDQNTNDRIAPDTSNVKLITPAASGPTITEAKNTWPILSQILDNLSNFKSKEEFITNE